MVESQTQLALKSLSLVQSEDTFQSSKQTREKYQVGMTLSEGNFAMVKQVKEKTKEKELLLRVINKAKVFGREDLILREVTIMKMLRQENVMQVVDHWETSDDMYLVVENIEVCVMYIYMHAVVPHTVAKFANDNNLFHLGY